MFPPRPSIDVDQEKCGNAAECMKCVLACPVRILGILQEQPPEPGGKGAERYYVIAAFRVMCIACRKCESACEKGAIRVDAGG